MRRVQAFNFSVLWKSEYTVQGHKISLEHTNSRKKFSQKLMNTFWNFKDFVLKANNISKRNPIAHKIIKGFVAVEVSSFLLFKFLNLKPENKTVNKLFNHDSSKSYIINSLILNVCGLYFALSYSKLFYRVMFSGVALTIPVLIYSEKLNDWIENQFLLDNFEFFSEHNMIPKTFLAASFFKFLDNFITEKKWNVSLRGGSGYKINRKVFVLFFSVIFATKISQFLSHFISDDINLFNTNGFLALLTSMLILKPTFLPKFILLFYFNPYSFIAWIGAKNKHEPDELAKLYKCKGYWDRFTTYVKFITLMSASSMLEIYF